MSVRIRHSTEYVFSKPVFIEPHLVRMHPRPGSGYVIDSHTVGFQPDDVEARDLVEFDGGRATLLTCATLTDHLRIEAETVLSFGEHNPFNFLLYPMEILSVEGLSTYARDPQFAPYIYRDEASSEVDAFARAAVERAGGETLDFLSQLTEALRTQLTYNVRESGDAYTPVETLSRGEGACRDFAVLYIDICRAVGIPARFVSGYLADVEDDQAQYLHAWVEVFLPGAGWRGYDPTHGIAATNRYIATAAARSPEDAAPVSGTFRGNNATAELNTVVQIEELG